MIVMRTARLMVSLVALMITLSLASVYGAGYTVAVPILGTSGSPALSGNLFTGVITVLYADGMPVLLGSNSVTLYLCSNSTSIQPMIPQNTGCWTIRTTLKETAPGTYAYSFFPPTTLAGMVTITVAAGSLADDNGRVFPSVDTQVATYAAPPLTSTSAPPSAEALPASAPLATGVTRDAVETIQPAQSSPVPVAVALAVLTLAAIGVLVLPSHKNRV